MRSALPIKRAGALRSKSGRHSALSRDLANRYREAREDPELLALRDEIALLDVRLGEVLARL